MVRFGALTQEYFNTALWTFFQFPEALMWRRLKRAPKHYHLVPSELTADCWKFVKGLLDPDPIKRTGLKTALDCPLMRKVARDLNDTYFVDYPFIE